MRHSNLTLALVFVTLGCEQPYAKPEAISLQTNSEDCVPPSCLADPITLHEATELVQSFLKFGDHSLDERINRDWEFLRSQYKSGDQLFRWEKMTGPKIYQQGISVRRDGKMLFCIYLGTARNLH